MAKVEDRPYKVSAQQIFDSSLKREIIPTTLGMDTALSGGIVRGQTIILGSGQKQGKTSYSLFIAAQAQKIYGAKVFYYNLEGRLTNLVLSQIPGLKMDEENFTVFCPPPIKDADGKICGFRKWPMESVLEHVGNVILENPGCVLIIDSISNISSAKEISENLSHVDMGAHNKIESAFCRKYLEMVVPNRVTAIFICQLIQNPGAYGYPWKMKIGSTFKFAADTILFGRSFKKWDADPSGRVAGHDVGFLVEASALGQPFLEAKLALCYGSGPDKYKDIGDYCIDWGFVKKSGSWFNLPFIEEKGQLKYIELKDKAEENEDANEDEIEEIKPKKKKEKKIEVEEKNLKVQGKSDLYTWLKQNSKECDLLDNMIREKLFGVKK